MRLMQNFCGSAGMPRPVRSWSRVNRSGEPKRIARKGVLQEPLVASRVNLASITLLLLLSASMARALPDLVVEDIWSSPGSLTEGEGFSLYARVRNTGDQTASAGMF